MPDDLSPELLDQLALNLIPSLGPRLTAALLRHFGSAGAVRRATAAASFFSSARAAASRSITASRSASSGSVTIAACGSRFRTTSRRSSGTRSRYRAESRVSFALAM